ncbi:MAG: hypothetical protein ABFS34_06985 [Gemmatimonadota bacterium]
MSDPASAPTARDRKFRQAAIVYLHVGVLYEAAVVALWRAGLVPDRGPVGLWLLVGALITGGVTWALWRYRSPWVPRAIWALHALRLPSVIGGAFGLDQTTTLPRGLWTLALIAVLINLGFLARAGWDL